MPALIFLGSSLNTEYWRIFFLALIGWVVGRAVHDSAAARALRAMSKKPFAVASFSSTVRWARPRAGQCGVKAHRSIFLLDTT